MDSTQLPNVGHSPCKEPSKRRLIVCCDGTWNDSISTESPLTNVARISRCIPGVSESGIVQIVAYYSGIGSGTSRSGNTIDGMTGRGISAIIREAYTFICHNYLSDKDEIILIGFSRGAFAVRGIASFITDIGLLSKTGLHYLMKLYRVWSTKLSKEVIFSTGKDMPKISLESFCMQLAGRRLLRTNVHIKVCAVWETVGSLGFPMPGPIPQRVSKKLAFINSTLPRSIEVAIQALALNERRKHFLPTVWIDNSETELKQCWFLGAHSNVGGGYEDTGLANLALVWVIAQLDNYLFFDREALLHFTRNTTANETEKEFSMSISLGMPGISMEYSKTIYSSSIRRTAGKVKNSVKGPFLLAGTTSRKPGQYLMNTHGLYRNRKDAPVLTNETMHWTVRVLLGKGYRKCPALKKYATELENGNRIIWKLYSKGVQTAIQLPEEEFSPLERDILVSWMEAESGYHHRRFNAVGVSFSGRAVVSLPDILLPLLDETETPTVHFPWRRGSDRQRHDI